MSDIIIDRETIEKKKIKLAIYEGKDKVIHSSDILANIKDPAWSIRTRFRDFDKIVDGFEPGELVTISGKTGAGKTLFCQSITREFYEQRIPTVWFSYEMTARQLLKRFPEMPSFYMPSLLETNNVGWIFDRLIESIAKYDVKAAFFDHLHYLIDMYHAKQPSLQIGTICRNLKRLAINLDIVIFLMCHVTKVPQNEKATMADLRDSGLIAGESDKVVMVNRRGQDEAVITSAKDRRMGWLEGMEGCECVFKKRENEPFLSEVVKNQPEVPKAGSIMPEWWDK